MVRLLIGATVLASAGLAFGPATSASADTQLCYYVAGSGTVNAHVGPICEPFIGSFCDSDQLVLGNPETLSYEVCVPSPIID
jgi:hypothetical protein